jgi:general secretion pathway protein A
VPAGPEVAAPISEPATANPKPAPVAQQPGLDEHLVLLSTDAKPEPGILTLLSLWGIDYNPAAGTACGQAEAQGYSCYYQRGSLNGIRQLDRPGVLTLTDSLGKLHEPVLVSMNDDVAELSFGGNHVSFPVDEVADIWFGQYLLIWRPPGGTPVAISPGMQNENVRWLRQSLAALDSDYQPQPADSDFFDEELQQQVMAFQRKHRLQADGLAGQKTQIIINSLLAQDGTPRLTSTR